MRQDIDLRHVGKFADVDARWRCRRPGRSPRRLMVPEVVLVPGVTSPDTTMRGMVA